MDDIVFKIVNRMIVLGLILISAIWILTKKYIETIVFYFTFSWLRFYTNVYHSKNYKACLSQSAVLYILICKVISLLFIKYVIVFHFITLVSMDITYALSPVNSESIVLNKKEITKYKDIVKYILITYFIILAIFINFKGKSEIVVFLKWQS